MKRKFGILTIGSLSVALLVAGTSSSAVATASPSVPSIGVVQIRHSSAPSSVTKNGPITDASDTLLDQSANYTGWGVWHNNSINLADHFTIPAGHTWSINNVTAPGFYDYGNPGVIPIRLTLYTDTTKRGVQQPGRKIASFDSWSHNYDANFTFDISSKHYELKSGTYWYEVNTVGETNYFWAHELRMPRTGAAFKQKSVSSYTAWYDADWTNDTMGYNTILIVRGRDNY